MRRSCNPSGARPGRTRPTAARLRRAAGFTLVEVLVACALLALLMTMVYQVLAPSMREIRKGGADAETQQSALVALDRIFQEAALSDPTSVRFLQSPPALSFLSPEALGRSGTTAPTPAPYRTTGLASDLTFRKFVLLYHDPGERLIYLKEIPYDGERKLAALTGTSMSTLIASAAYPPRVVARHIQYLSFSRPRPPAVLVDVASVVEGFSSHKETRVQMAIAMRN